MTTGNMKRQKIFLTTLVNQESDLKTRFGIRVTIKDFLKNYELYGGEKVAAFLLKYTPPLEKPLLGKHFGYNPIINSKSKDVSITNTTQEKNTFDSTTSR